MSRIGIVGVPLDLGGGRRPSEIFSAKIAQTGGLQAQFTRGLQMGHPHAAGADQQKAFGQDRNPLEEGRFGQLRRNERRYSNSPPHRLPVSEMADRPHRGTLHP